MSSISPVTTTATTPTTQSGASSQGALLSSDFKTFLKMLTTQARNQDPLNPMDSSDYAQQLATFSGVEQQVRTNTLLESLAAQLGGGGLTQYAPWVGMEARVTAPVSFDGAPLTLYLSPVSGADRADLVTLDSAGNEVARYTAPLGTGSIVWAGTDATGQSLPSGTYSFRLEGYSGDTLIGATAVESYARINEVRSDGAGTVFTLDGGAEVTVNGIGALRTAG